MNRDATWEQTVVIVGTGLTGGSTAVTCEKRDGKTALCYSVLIQHFLSGVLPSPKPIYEGRKHATPGMSSPTNGYSTHDVEV